MERDRKEAADGDDRRWHGGCCRVSHPRARGGLGSRAPHCLLGWKEIGQRESMVWATLLQTPLNTKTKPSLQVQQLVELVCNVVLPYNCTFTTIRAKNHPNKINPARLTTVRFQRPHLLPTHVICKEM